MNKFFKSGLATFALMIAFGALFAAETRAQGNIPNEILKRMEAHRKSLTSLQANVMMDKFSSQIDEHDVTEGTMMYLPAKGRDALVRIDWLRPVQETLSVVNKQYVVYRPRLNRAIIGKVDQKSKETKGTNALAFMSMSTEQLKATYNRQYLGEEQVSGGVNTYHLKLTPKTESNYQYAEIWVDGNGMPVQAKVVEKNNDSTTVLLSSLQKNVTLDAKKFKVSLPKGTEIAKA